MMIGTGSQRNPLGNIEEQLARQMAQMKIHSTRTTKEVERICTDSDEIKALKEKINHAYLNKERIAQMTEKHYRTQKEIEEDALKDRAMLRQKEIEDLANFEKLRRDKDAAFEHKRVSAIYFKISNYFIESSRANG